MARNPKVIALTPLSRSLGNLKGAVAMAHESGPLVRVQHHSGHFASHVTINSNQFWNDTAGSGILLESAQHVSVTSNDLHWSVPAPSFLGIWLGSTIAPADEVLIQGNRIDGALLAGVFLAAVDLWVDKGATPTHST